LAGIVAGMGTKKTGEGDERSVKSENSKIQTSKKSLRLYFRAPKLHPSGKRPGDETVSTLNDDDAFLETVKSTMNDEHQSLLGIQVGQKKQALVVKLSDERKLKKSLTILQTGAGNGLQESRFRCSLPLIHPFSKRLMVWQAVLVVMIIYNMLFVPYELAYGKCATSATTDALDAVADACFLLDVVVEFHVMLVINEKHTDRTLIVDDQRVIAKNYLRFQFWIDVLSIGPPFGSEQALADNAKYFKVGMLKILKLFRIAKAFKILGTMVTVSASVVQRFNVARLILLIIYCGHLLGCAFSGVARVSQLPNNWVEGKVYDNTAAIFDSCSGDDPKPPTEEYIAALYWAVMTLTTVGYGDVSAQNKYEMLFSSCVMVGGAIFYALVLGSVTSAIQELSSGDQAMLLKMKMADKFIGRYNLNTEMAGRLRQSIVLQGEWSNDSFAEVFHSCHPEFRAELLMTIHRPILIKTSFFRGIDDAFLKLIVGHLKMHVCLENDCIYKAGSDGEAMFLLNQGFVGIYQKKAATRTTLLEPGDAFGLGAVLSRELSMRIETAVAEVRSVVHSLSRESLHNAAVSFPKVHELMQLRVIALMKKREERRVHVESAGNTDTDSASNTVTVDVFQGKNLPSTADIMNTNFFCRATVFVSCEACIKQNQGFSAEATSASPRRRPSDDKNGVSPADADAQSTPHRKLSVAAPTSKFASLSVTRRQLFAADDTLAGGEAPRQWEYGTLFCANCTVKRKATQGEAQTFDPEWNETIEFKVPSGKDVTVSIGLYQKALVPVLVGYIQVGTEAMRNPHVAWWHLQKPKVLSMRKRCVLRRCYYI
jgi:CRP-like cAMP-binding protein